MRLGVRNKRDDDKTKRIRERKRKGKKFARDEQNAHASRGV